MATTPETYDTAFASMQALRIEEGDTILVRSGSSGVGTAFAKLVTAQFLCIRIYASARNTGKKAMLCDEQLPLYEYYARKNGLQGKSLLILMWIYYNPHGITQKTVCEKTYSTKQVVNAAVKNLLAAHYVYFEEAVHDKRNKLIKMTEQGREYASRILDPLERVEMEALSVLDNGEQKLLIKLMHVYGNRFQQHIIAAALSKLIMFFSRQNGSTENKPSLLAVFYYPERIGVKDD